MSKSKLLIPLDGSEFSRKILPHVRTIIASDAYQVVLLQVAAPPKGVTAAATSAPAYVVYADQEEQTIKLKLVSEMRRDAETLEEAGFTVSREVRFGDPAGEIVSFVEQEGVGLVAMATHGRTGLARLLLGSVAEKVLRRLAVPIVLVQPIEVDSRESGEASWEQVAGDWERYRDRAKRIWGKLTVAELEVIAGDRERLLDKVREAYGLTLEDAEKEVENWRLGL